MRVDLVWVKIRRQRTIYILLAAARVGSFYNGWLFQILQSNFNNWKKISKREGWKLNILILNFQTKNVAIVYSSTTFKNMSKSRFSALFILDYSIIISPKCTKHVNDFLSLIWVERSGSGFPHDSESLHKNVLSHLLILIFNMNILLSTIYVRILSGLIESIYTKISFIHINSN